MSTIDGGTTWQMNILDPYPSLMTLTGLDFIDSGHGWVCGQSGGLLMGTNFPVNIETNVSNANLSIYPNPICSSVYISSAEKIQTISVINELGVCLNIRNRINQNEYELDFTEYPSGIYFIRIDALVRKVIKL